MNKKVYIGSVSTSVKAKRALWCVVSALLFRPFGTKLFRLWRLFLLKLFGADVSWQCDVYSSVRLWAPWNLTMEAGSCLGPNVICYNQARVILGRNACVSQYAYLCTAGHDIRGIADDQPLNSAAAGLVVADIVLMPDAWVGTQAFIGMGVTVGERAVIGARANVFKDVEVLSVVYASVGRSSSL